MFLTPQNPIITGGPTLKGFATRSVSERSLLSASSASANRAPMAFDRPDAISRGMQQRTETVWSKVMTRATEEGHSSPSCPLKLRTPIWSQLALDIHVAARTKVPVLISAPPDCAVEPRPRHRRVCRRVERRRRRGLRLCRVETTSATAVASALSVRGRHPSEVILLLREVHALDAAGQAAVANLVAAWYAGRGSAPDHLDLLRVAVRSRPARRLRRDAVLQPQRSAHRRPDDVVGLSAERGCRVGDPGGLRPAPTAAAASRPASCAFRRRRSTRLDRRRGRARR